MGETVQSRFEDIVDSILDHTPYGETAHSKEEELLLELKEAIEEGGGGGGGTVVIANPTLSGNEDDLTGLQVGSRKYKIETGGESGFSAIATLFANAWANNQQTVTFTGYTASMNGVIGVPSSSTGAQLLAYKDAGVYVVSQSGNQVTFGCDEVPSTDLLVGIYAGGGNGGSGGDAVWGSITGTLADQTDLQAALNSKATMSEVVAYVNQTVLGGAD